MNDMNILIDENITFAQEAFSSLGNVSLIDGRILKNKDLSDVDILIVRSITNVNEALLKHCKVRFVGTTTIGTDHIDVEYLRKRNIHFADAKGCNADSVAEYVFTALLKIATRKKVSLREKTIGVVGIGNIGSRVVKLASSLGMKVLQNDPPLQRISNGKMFVSLEEIFQADIITLHIPLTLDGIDKTFHLLKKNNLKKIKQGSVLMNTSRGVVIDNITLASESIKKKFKLVLDVWENEPSIKTELLSKTTIATPHIAGYSFEGKVNGTKMIYDSLCNYLQVEPVWQPALPRIEHSEKMIPKGKTIQERFFKLFSTIYDIERDDERMRKILNYKPNEQAGYFDLMRKEYPLRREFSNYTIVITKNEMSFKSFLEDFRFTVKII